MKNVRVLEADSAEKALAALNENDISLILLDITSLNTDGIVLCWSIRENSHTPIVIMTSEKGGEMLKRIKELDINDFITKPLNALITLETVHGILYGGGARS